MNGPYWSQEGHIERRIPNDELMAEAKRLIAEIESQNPRLKQVSQAADAIAQRQALLDQVALWKNRADQLEAELKVVREDKNVFAHKAGRLEVALRRQQELNAKPLEFTPYPTMPIGATGQPATDPRDWTTDETERWTWTWSPDEESRLTRFADHPVTRFVAFATANVGFGIYLLLHSGIRFIW